MTLLQSLVRSSINPTQRDALAAQANPVPSAAFGIPSFYLDSAVRSTMRALLDAAGNSGSTMRLGFYKDGGEMRYMVARPIPDADCTNKYYTVQDLELSEQRGEAVYRRVNLDRVVAAVVEFHAAAMVAA